MFLGANSKRTQREFRQRYTIYGATESYFTQKLLVGCEWHLDGQFAMVQKIAENDQETLERRLAVHEIPVIRVSEHASTSAWTSKDATPLLQLLDSRMKVPKFYPGDAFTRCIVLLLEQYFDRSMARMVFHSRRRQDAIILDAAQETVIESSGGIAMVAVASGADHGDAEEEFGRLMAAFADHLAAGNRFFLGESPCAVDCALVAGLQSLPDDSWPSGAAGREPLRWWCDEEACRPVPSTTHVQCLDPKRLPAFAHLALREMGTEYASYLCPPSAKSSRDALRQSWRVALGTDKSAEFKLRQTLCKYGLHDLYAPISNL